LDHLVRAFDALAPDLANLVTPAINIALFVLLIAWSNQAFRFFLHHQHHQLQTSLGQQLTAAILDLHYPPAAATLTVSFLSDLWKLANGLCFRSSSAMRYL
jgi:hypothetical protein